MPIRLEWDLLGPEDNVARYVIERRTLHVDAAVLGRLRRFWHNATGARSLIGGWRQVAEVPATQNYLEDDGRMLVRRFLRPTYYHNSEILDYVHYEYRIRAIGHNNQAGLWRHCRVTPLTAPPVIDYIIQGTVEDIHGHSIPNATISVASVRAPRFTPPARTNGDGEYQFPLGHAPPAGAADDAIFCEPTRAHYRIVAFHVPMPSAAHPIIICDFQLIPRVRAIPLHVAMGMIPAGYGPW